MSVLTIMNSVRPGDFWLHGAPTAHLNTTFLLNCAAHWAGSGVWHVAVISSELSAAVLQRKMPADYDDTRVVFYEPDEWEHLLQDPGGSLLSWNMLIVDRFHGFPGRMSMNYWDEVQRTLRDMHEKLLSRPDRDIALMASYQAHRESLQEAHERDRRLTHEASIATFGIWAPPTLTLQSIKFREKRDLFRQSLFAAPERGWIDLAGNHLSSSPASAI